MSKHKSKYVLMITTFLLASCLATQPFPALLEQPSADSRLLLEKAIGDLLNSRPIKLADNVFTKKNSVIIERGQPKNNLGRLLDGREIRPADSVSLYTKNGKCYLRHDQSNQIKLLGNIKCRVI